MSEHPFNFPREPVQPERSSTEEEEELSGDEQEQIQVDEGNGEGPANEENPIPAGNVAAENLVVEQQLEEPSNRGYQNILSRFLANLTLEGFDASNPSTIFLEYKTALESLNVRFTDNQLLKVLDSAVKSLDMSAFVLEVVMEELLLLKASESVADMKAMREEKLKRGRDREDDDDNNNQGGSGIPQKMVK